MNGHLLALALLAAPLSSQAPRAITSTPAMFPTPFSSVMHFAELADGRVLIYDAVERRFSAADFRSGRLTDVARQGAGPLEYRVVSALHRAAGDSVLLWDPANSRISVIAPNGTMLGSWGDSRMGELSRILPAAVAGGRWFVPMRPAFSPDTTTLVRVTLATQRTDTLLRFATPTLRPDRTAPPGVVRVIAPGFQPVTGWGVFPDGRVLVVHGGDYRPEIFNIDGISTKAAAIPFTPTPVTAADKARHLQETVAELKRRLTGELASGPGGKMPKLEAGAPDRWPATLPLVRSATIHVDSRDRAWVLVTDPTRAAGDRFDLLNAQGKHIDAVRLPPQVKLVGMGRGVFYATREDGDGLLHLLRYPLP
ncbi:MAG: hypothetical protein IPJ11_14010 [Gemmatimonadetes bacterium]|nr:hypothetical protein [Gemmatimonadota bacterium]